MFTLNSLKCLSRAVLLFHAFLLLMSESLVCYQCDIWMSLQEAWICLRCQLLAFTWRALIFRLLAAQSVDRPVASTSAIYRSVLQRYCNMYQYLLYAVVAVSLFCVCLNVCFLLGRLGRVDLIIWVRCPSVCPSTKSFSDSDEIWYVGRGRWVMHDGMPYDLIQGQGQSHETFKVRNSLIFKIYLLPYF